MSYLLVSGEDAINMKRNHESITVKVGDAYELLCQALDAEVKACAFITPYGETYVLWGEDAR